MTFGTIYGRANGSFRIQDDSDNNDSTGLTDLGAAFQVREFTRDTGNTAKDFVDGTLTHTSSAGKFSGPLNLSIVGGRRGITAQLYLDGDIVEVLIYSSELSADDRQLVEGSLAWKYGLEGNLPGGHPHKNVDPNIGPDVGTVVTLR